MKKIIIFISYFLLCNEVFAAPLTTQQSLQRVVFAAGEGSRFKLGTTKLTIPICGQAMVLFTIKLMEGLGIPCTAVIGYQKEAVRKVIDEAHIKNITFAEQKEQLGTAHALMASKDFWNADHILVVNGDNPLTTPEIIKALYDAHLKNNSAASIVTSINLDPACANGRIVRKGDHVKIVEKKHFTGRIQDHPETNVGLYLFKRSFLEKHISQVQAKPNGAKHEYYITDLLEIASDNHLPVITVPMPFDRMQGANHFQELATVEQIKRDDLIHHFMAQGVRFTMPQSVHLDVNVTIGKGTVIEGAAHITNGTKIGEWCTIKPFVVLDNVEVKDRATVQAHSALKDIAVS